MKPQRNPRIPLLCIQINAFFEIGFRFFTALFATLSKVPENVLKHTVMEKTVPFLSPFRVTFYLPDSNGTRSVIGIQKWGKSTCQQANNK